MKNKLSIVLFIVTFFITYLIICFAIPGMRIKLQAAPMEYFMKSIKHMAFFKWMISVAVALIVGIMPKLFTKK